MHRRERAAILVLLSCLGSGCGLVLGLGEFQDGDGTGHGGSGTTSGSSSGATTGSGGGAGGTTSSGPMCTPNETMPCMTGKPGVCAPGTATCKPDGSSFVCVQKVQATTEDCTLKGDEDCDGVACSDCVWSFVAGDAKFNTFKQVTSMAVDAQGDLFLAGYLTGSFELLNNADPAKNVTLSSFGSNDVWLAKLDPAGDVLWGKTFGSAGSDIASRPFVAVGANGNIAIATGFENTANFGGVAITAPNGKRNLVVALYDGAGVFQWQRQLGSATVGATASAVAFDSKGDVIVAGSYSGGALSVPLMAGGPLLLSNNGDNDVVIAKLASASLGKATWGTRIGEDSGANPSSDQPAAMVIDSSDAIYLTGTFTTAIHIKDQFYFTKGGDDVFLAKLDSQGAISSSAAFGSPGSDEVDSIAVDSMGSMIVTGQVYGATDFGTGAMPIVGPRAAYLAKYSSAGKCSWAKVFGGPIGSAAGGRALAVDPADDIFMTAFTLDDIDFGLGVLDYTGSNGDAEIVLAKYKPGGAAIWAKIFGDQDDESPFAMVTDPPSQGPVIAGRCTGTVDFGTGPLMAAGNDVCVAKFQP